MYNVSLQIVANRLMRIMNADVVTGGDNSIVAGREFWSGFVNVRVGAPRYYMSKRGNIRTSGSLITYVIYVPHSLDKFYPPSFYPQVHCLSPAILTRPNRMTY